jgi:hypothetical protein
MDSNNLEKAEVFQDLIAAAAGFYTWPYAQKVLMV